MIIYNILIFVLGLSISNIFSQNLNDTKYDHNWYLSNYEKINEEIKNGTDGQVLTIISGIGNVWIERDGAIETEVSPAIANALIFKSEIMLKWFEQNPNELVAWIERVPYCLFTDYKGNQKTKLESIRRDLITSLNNYVRKTENGKLKQIAMKLIQKFNKTKIRKIQ